MFPARPAQEVRPCASAWRSPASVAVSLARTLSQDTNLTEERRHLLGLFEQAGQHMLDTLNSSLDLYKIEKGQYEPAAREFDILALVRSIIKELAFSFRDKQVRSEIRLSDMPSPLETSWLRQGDPKLLRTVLQNLLKNALEASPPGQVITMSLALGDVVRIEIANKGTVAPDIRDRFFDKYVTKGKIGGTGLGTYSAMMMVKAQGGDISMRTSEEENETVVTVRLPCSRRMPEPRSRE